jgi:hypothetical protein
MSARGKGPAFSQLNLVVRDMSATLAFWRRLGLVPEVMPGGAHAAAELTAAGYPGRQVPYDAFWGSRYAIVEDPDGVPVGLMSPAEDEYRSPPPGQAPAS